MTTKTKNAALAKIEAKMDAVRAEARQQADARQQPPSFSEVKRVVRAFMKANYPDEKIVSIAGFTAIGCGTIDLPIIGSDRDISTAAKPRKAASPSTEAAFDPSNPDDERKVREAVAAFWAFAVGTIATLVQRMEAIAEEAYQPASPLFGFIDGKRWDKVAGRLNDADIESCRMMVDISDPLAALATRLSFAGSS